MGIDNQNIHFCQVRSYSQDQGHLRSEILSVSQVEYGYHASASYWGVLCFGRGAVV
jgi:hypothetical protein